MGMGVCSGGVPQSCCERRGSGGCPPWQFPLSLVLPPAWVRVAGGAPSNTRLAASPSASAGLWWWCVLPACQSHFGGRLATTLSTHAQIYDGYPCACGNGAMHGTPKAQRPEKLQGISREQFSPAGAGLLRGRQGDCCLSPQHRWPPLAGAAGTGHHCNGTVSILPGYGWVQPCTSSR